MTDEEVSVPDAPDVQGLVFRRFRGDEDLAPIVEVFEALSQEDGLEWVLTVDRLRNEYASKPNFDPRKDVVIAEVNGRAVGYTQVYWFKEEDGTLAVGHRERVHPKWRGTGIPEALLAVNTVRARQMAAAHTDGPWRMGTVVAESEVHRLSVIEHAGYRKERWYLELLRDLREPIQELPLPEGIEVRSVAPADRRRVFETLWEAFRGSYAFREMDDKDWTGFKGSHEYQPDLWVIGWDGDVVAGIVFSWIDEDENSRYDRLWGYNDAVAVAKEHRRRGLAKALISRSLLLLRDKGMEFASLGVDTQNPADAFGLYKGLGYVVRQKFIDLIRPME